MATRAEINRRRARVVELREKRLSIDRIARQLGVSPRTVNSDLQTACSSGEIAQESGPVGTRTGDPILSFDASSGAAYTVEAQHDLRAALGHR